jgi:hypothetical protein
MQQHLQRLDILPIPANWTQLILLLPYEQCSHNPLRNEAILPNSL